MLVIGTEWNARAVEESLPSEKEARMESVSEKVERRTGMGNWRWRVGAELLNMRTIDIPFTITITVRLLINLIVLNPADTQAVVPFLRYFADFATLGGPAPRAAGTPQKRGPLPPPTRGRGRLPFWRANPLAGVGPKLPWQNAGVPCKYFLIRARRAGSAEAMARIGMAPLDVTNGNGKGEVLFIGYIVFIAPHPPPHLAAPILYLGKGNGGCDDQGKLCLVTLLLTPGHTKLNLIIITFTAMVVSR